MPPAFLKIYIYLTGTGALLFRLFLKQHFSRSIEQKLHLINRALRSNNDMY